MSHCTGVVQWAPWAAAGIDPTSPIDCGSLCSRLSRSPTFPSGASLFESGPPTCQLPILELP